MCQYFVSSKAILDTPSSLLKLRNELINLINQHTTRISDPLGKATAQSTIFEGVLKGLNVGFLFVYFSISANLSVTEDYTSHSAPQIATRNCILGVSGRRGPTEDVVCRTGTKAIDDCLLSCKGNVLISSSNTLFV